jgi:hypothetical protein
MNTGAGPRAHRSRAPVRIPHATYGWRTIKSGCDRVRKIMSLSLRLRRSGGRPLARRTGVRVARHGLSLARPASCSGADWARNSLP